MAEPATDVSSITDIIAIDGPAGAGKSTVARRVAERLGYAFLDTGAMYRAATWNAVAQGIDLNDASALAEATRRMRLDISEGDGRQTVVVDGHDVTAAIRTPEITSQIHYLDRTPEVRSTLVDIQRRFGAGRPTVAEGRDIGTVVFPQARCKVYMVASLDERTRRRREELRGKGVDVSFEQLREEIRVRDELSMTRAVAPLRPAADAIHIDTTSLTVDEVVGRIIDIAGRTD